MEPLHPTQVGGARVAMVKNGSTVNCVEQRLKTPLCCISLPLWSHRWLKDFLKLRSRIGLEPLHFITFRWHSDLTLELTDLKQYFPSSSNSIIS